MIIARKLPDRLLGLPEYYREEGTIEGVQRFYRRLTDGMTVICGWENHDGGWWLHVSCAKMRLQKLPRWDDLLEVKNIFIGKDKKAIQIFPEEANYVNINPFCHHLFYTEYFGIPEFSWDNLL